MKIESTLIKWVRIAPATTQSALGSQNDTNLTMICQNPRGSKGLALGRPTHVVPPSRIGWNCSEGQIKNRCFFASPRGHYHILFTPEAIPQRMHLIPFEIGVPAGKTTKSNEATIALTLVNRRP